jgi:hypothetical protein
MPSDGRRHASVDQVDVHRLGSFLDLNFPHRSHGFHPLHPAPFLAGKAKTAEPERFNALLPVPKNPLNIRKAHPS